MSLIKSGCIAKLPNGETCGEPTNQYSEYCKLHGPALALIPNEGKALYNIHKDEFRKRLLEFKDNPKYRSLREEVGILRLSLEHVLNACQETDDFILRTGEITSLTRSIESLLKTTLSIEKESGQLLSQEEAVQLASTLINILIQNVKEYAEKVKAAPDTVDDLSLELIEKIADSYAKVLNEKRDI